MQADVWQAWEADKGKWYTSQELSCDGYTLPASGGDTTDSLADIAAGCSDAVIDTLGVNIGPNNPSSVVATDGIRIVTSNLNIAYDFQPK
ncbi:MAG: hypothetical protein JO291_11520 [Acidimicrobiia bacterium]|nr:hypothetical protein [Acidimicrobiia bacterium]